MSRTYLKIEQHDTQADLFEALCRAFTEQENNGTRWVSFTRSHWRLMDSLCWGVTGSQPISSNMFTRVVASFIKNSFAWA